MKSDGFRKAMTALTVVHAMAFEIARAIGDDRQMIRQLRDAERTAALAST